MSNFAFATAGRIVFGRVKASLRHPAMLPVLAVIDPELTVTMPRSTR